MLNKSNLSGVNSISKSHLLIQLAMFVKAHSLCNNFYFLYSVFCVPFTAWDYAFPHWIFGDIWCRVSHFIFYSKNYIEFVRWRENFLVSREGKRNLRATCSWHDAHSSLELDLTHQSYFEYAQSYLP